MIRQPEKMSLSYLFANVILFRQTQLPPDYIDLEKQVDALKQAHQKMIAVT